MTQRFKILNNASDCKDAQKKKKKLLLVFISR